MMSTTEEDFELELRSLPGVLNVSIERDGDALGVVTLLVYGPNARETEAVAQQIATLYFPEARIVVESANEELTPAGTSGARVVLEHAIFDPTSGGCEVELSFAGRRAFGRTGSGPLIGGAEATLAALADLGFDIPFTLLSVTNVTALRSWPVIVALRSRENGDDRFGVAQADEDVLAAAKATLDALNRFAASH
jgi:hypothetical protein